MRGARQTWLTPQMIRGLRKLLQLANADLQGSEPDDFTPTERAQMQAALVWFDKLDRAQAKVSARARLNDDDPCCGFCDYAEDDGHLVKRCTSCAAKRAVREAEARR